MSQTIDSKIVEMKFNNKDFEKNAGDSLKTLDNLKKKLNFEESIKSIGALSESLKHVSFDQMNNSISGIANGFTATGAIIFGVIQNIVNAAINAGKQIANALVIDPVKLGFQEYELKMGSIQTIMAGTGESLDTVNRYLDELNEYSDRTIYSFSDMTQNIGKFTNAGVKLDLAVSSIKGIANVAALSGANANEAARAMYNFSQALSQGSVRLIDWKSIELANMGTAGFKQQIIDTALAMGTLTKAADGTIKTLKGTNVTTKEFQYTLDDGWFTSDVLTTVLTKYTDETTELGKSATAAAQDVKTFSQMLSTMKESAQSGWAKTWELFFGDFEQGKSLWTELNNIFGGMITSSADIRNNFLSLWKDMGGRTLLLDSFRNAIEAVKIAIKPIADVFKEIFPPITVLNAFKLTNAIRVFTENLKMGAETVDQVKRIFKGLFSLLDIGRMAIVSVGKGLGVLLDGLLPAGKGLLDFIVNIADYITNLRDLIKTTDYFGNVVAKITNFITKVVSNIKEFFNAFKEGFKGFDSSFDKSKLSEFVLTLKEKFKPLSGLIEFLGKFLSGLSSFVSAILPFVFKLSSIIGEGLNAFLDSITNGLNNFDPEKVFAVLNNFLFSGVLLGIKNFLDKGSVIFGEVADVLGTVRESLQAWQSNLKADTLLKLAAAVGILAASILVISIIDSDKLVASLGAMTAMFLELIGALSILDKTSNLNATSASSMMIGLIGIASSMLILSLSLEKLGRMDAKQLVRGIVGISAISALLIVVAQTLSKNSSFLISGAAGLVVFSYAVLLLTKSVVTLGEMNQEGLTNGLIGIAAILGGISIFLQNSNLGNSSIKGAAGILVLSLALNLIVLAVKNLGSMNPEDLIKGLSGIGLILGGIVIFVNSLSNTAGLITTAIGLTILSGAILILTFAIEKLSGISWEGITKGLVGIGSALAIIVVAMSSFPPNAMLNALTLLVIAGSLVVLAKALATMGGMSWEQVAVSMTALAGSLSLLALAMYAMSAGLPGASALIVAAGALLILAPALKMLGEMSLEEIGIAILAMAATFVILGVAGSVLTPVVPTLLALGGAMLLIGLGAAAVGVGVLAFSAGLTALAAAGAAGVGALVLAITSIVSLLPMILKQLGKSIIILIETIAAGAPALLNAVVAIGTTLIDGLIVLIPKLVDGIYLLIEKILVTLAEKLPDFIKAGYTIILALLNGIADNIEEIASVAIDIVTNFIDGISSMIPELVNAGYNFIISYIDALAAGAEENIPRLMESLRGLGLAILKGILTGLIEGRSQIVEGIWELATILIDEFKRVLGINSPSTVFFEFAQFIIAGLINGLASGSALVFSAITGLVTNMLLSFSQRLLEFVNVGISFITSLISGISDTAIFVYSIFQTLLSLVLGILISKYSDFRQTAIQLVLAFISGVNDYISRVVNSAISMINQFKAALSNSYNQIRQIGINLVLGFISGINDYVYQAVQAAYNLSSSVLSTIANTLKIKSPSRVLYEFGKFVVLGFSGGIYENANAVLKTVDALANDTVNGFETIKDRIKNIIESEINFDPTITPVLDLSDIYKKSELLNGLMPAGSLSLTTSPALAKSVVIGDQQQSVDQIANNISTTPSNVQFVQNNYSPEPLSRLEIYRQTRIQLNQAKGLLNRK